MTTQRWISLLLVSLSFAIIAMGWVARPGLCLDSMVVEKIDSVSVDGTETLNVCRGSREGNFSEKLSDLKFRLEAKLKPLERTLDFMGLKISRVKVSIVDSLDPIVRIHPAHVIFSRSLLNKHQLFEKSLLIAMLIQKPIQELRPEEILWTEVFSDLFLAHADGGLNLDDSILNQTLRWEGRKTQWPFVLKTSSGYCADGWRSLLHVTSCDRGDLDSSQLLVSLRPLIGASLNSALNSVGADERLRWMRQLASHWSQWQPHSLMVPSEISKDSERQLFQTSQAVAGLSTQFQNWSKESPVWKNVASEFETQLRLRGFGVNLSSFAVDLLILQGDAKASAMVETLYEESVSPDKNVVLLNGEEAHLLPDSKSIPADWLGSLPTRQAVLIQCSIPTIEKMKSWSDRAEKLLLIRVCDSKMRMNWKNLLAGRIDDFIRANPNATVVQFHLPSLKSALNKKNLNPIPLLQGQLWHNPFFKEIGWESPQWDQDLQAFRTRAAIEAIEIFRVQPEENSSAL